MLIGTLTGTYSSIYVACPVVIFWGKIFVTAERDAGAKGELHGRDIGH